MSDECFIDKKIINVMMVTNPAIEKAQSKVLMIQGATMDQMVRLYTVICDWVGKENAR